MFRNILISLSLIGLCGCSHNPEITTAKQTSTPVYSKAETKTNFGELINMDLTEEPVKCYHWIPLDYNEKIKELDIHKNKN